MRAAVTLASMRVAVVVVALLGCQREPAQKHPNAPSPRHPAAAGAVEIVLTDEGVKPFDGTETFEEAAIGALLPGYTITVDEREYEGTPDNRLIVSRGGTDLVELAEDRDHTVGVVGVLSREVRSELGFGVGSTYEQVANKGGALACSKPPHDDPYADHVVCTSDELPSFELVFTPTTAPEPPTNDPDVDGLTFPPRRSRRS